MPFGVLGVCSSLSPPLIVACNKTGIVTMGVLRYRNRGHRHQHRTVSMDQTVTSRPDTPLTPTPKAGWVGHTWCRLGRGVCPCLVELPRVCVPRRCCGGVLPPGCGTATVPGSVLTVGRTLSWTLIGNRSVTTTTAVRCWPGLVVRALRSAGKATPTSQNPTSLPSPAGPPTACPMITYGVVSSTATGPIQHPRV